MASNLLSAFGITPAAPPASAYADQKAETANLADAKSQLAGVTSSLGLALTAAKLAGVDTTNLDNLNAEAASLASANLTAAQLEAKTTALTAKLATAQATQDAKRHEDAIAAQQAAVTTIQTRVALIKKDSTTSSPLLMQYTDLQKTSETALATLKAAPAKQGVDISGNAPDIPDPATFLSQLEDLDTAKDAEENKTFNWTRFGKKVTSVMMFYGTILSVALGVILGGIIMSNTFANDSFWGIKLYYFIYGAAFFPLSLIYGAVKSPYWVSGLLPLYSLDPTPVQAGGAFGLPSFSLPSFTIPPLPKIPTVAEIAKAAKEKVTTKISEVIAPRAPAAAPVPPPPAAPPLPVNPLLDPIPLGGPPPARLSTLDTLFGYKYIDSKTPTTAQISSKNKLRYFAIGELVFLGISTTYYGIDALITRNLIKV